MPEPPPSTSTPPAAPSAPGGQSPWDAQLWAPVVPVTPQAVRPPVSFPLPAVEAPAQVQTWYAALVCGLGIWSLLMALAMWALSTVQFQIVAAEGIAGIAAALLLGSIGGQLAVVFSLAPRTRRLPGLSIAGLVCGLVGLVLILFWILVVLLTDAGLIPD